MSIVAIFLLLALITFLLDTFGLPARVNLTPLGLAFFTIAFLIQAFGRA